MQGLKAPGMRAAATLVGLAASLLASPSLATEGGASTYLLGSGGPGAAVLPPLEGVYFANTAYHYDGKASGQRQFVVGGNLVAGLKGNINADFASLLWVPSTNFAGGVLALGAALPVGVPAVDVNAVIVGPRGRAVTISRSEDKLIVGDPLATAAIDWKRGDWHFQSAAVVNIPIGNYRPGRLSNLAFNRWVLDASVAATWQDEKSGWDISGKTGLTFNGENQSTDYDSGTEWHVEAAIEKRLSPKFSLGIQAYYLSQVTGDSGAGATLGPFKGQVTGIGATAAYNFTLGPTHPASLRLHVMTEMNAKNRLEGNSVFIDFVVPLSMKLPAAAP